MTSTRIAASTSLGRNEELRKLEQAVGAARRGHPQVLHVTGTAGFGKTTLLNDAATMGHDFERINLTATEFEASMPYAALEAMLASRLQRAGGLPEAQRHAIDVAFGRATGATPDRFLIGLAVAGLLSSQTPIMCTVDDAHLVDPSSAEDSAVASRRLQGNVLLIISSRPDDRVDRLFAHAPRIELASLDRVAARRLLARHLRGPMDKDVAEQVIGEAHGHPLTIVELMRRGGNRFAGGYDLLGHQDIHDNAVAALFEDELESLPPDTRLAVLLAAAEPTGNAPLFRVAAQQLGISTTAIEPATSSGILEVTPRVRFRHPLLRSMAYQSSTPQERRRIHSVLADCTDTDADPERAVWHRFLAASEPDEDLSRQLEAQAARAEERGGVAAGALFLEHAANASEDPGRVAQLQLRAAHARRNAGDLEAARSLIGSAHLNARDPGQLARASMLLAQMNYDQHYGRDDAEQLFDAAASVAVFDAPSAAEANLRALVAAMIAGASHNVPTPYEMARMLREKIHLTSGTSPVELTMQALVTALDEGGATSVAPARAAVEAISQLEDPSDGIDFVWVWLLCSLAWDDHSSIELGDRYLRSVQTSGRLAERPLALNCRAVMHLHAGELDRAERLASESEVARQITGADPNYVVVLPLAAWRGEYRHVEALAAQAYQQTQVNSGPRINTSIAYSKMLLFNGLGRYEDAIHVMDHDYDDIGFHVCIPPEQIEASARVGNLKRAVRFHERIAPHMEAAGTGWSMGLLYRSEALVGDQSRAEDMFQRSIDALGTSASLAQVARSQLLYGEWLRRRRRHLDAREVLRDALTVFREAGARGFASRAERELRAAGASAANMPEPRTPLTAQQLAVARLAAQGATTKEIAAALSLSPRTVDAHLRGVFPKLGVTSRREIGVALRRMELADDPHGHLPPEMNGRPQDLG